MVAKKAGTILSKDSLLKAPVPIGAQTITQVWQGWFKSMQRMEKKRKIKLTKVNPALMSTWTVDLLSAQKL